MTTQLTYTHARGNLAKLLNNVSLNNDVVVIKRRNAESVAMISERELKGLLETSHLLRSPKNAQRLLSAINSALNDTAKISGLNELKKEFGLE
jgi:antitoxin YefM